MRAALQMNDMFRLLIIFTSASRQRHLEVGFSAVHSRAWVLRSVPPAPPVPAAPCVSEPSTGRTLPLPHQAVSSAASPSPTSCLPTQQWHHLHMKPIAILTGSACNYKDCPRSRIYVRVTTLPCPHALDSTGLSHADDDVLMETWPSINSHRIQDVTINICTTHTFLHKPLTLTFNPQRIRGFGEFALYKFTFTLHHIKFLHL